MSEILKRLTYFRRERTLFSGEHGVLTTDDRRWEDAYRQRQQHDTVMPDVQTSLA